MAYYEKQPYIQPIHTLIKEVLDGSIRIPKFQREGTMITWNTNQRGDLLDSIFRVFPIGTLLLWSTKDDIKTLNQVEGFQIPELKNGEKRLLLDGHQRLSTLVHILGPALTDKERILEDDDEQENWVFDLSDPDSEEKTTRERFYPLKQDEKPSNLELPLSIVLNRVKLNNWIRERDISEECIYLADKLRDTLREYNIPVAVLVTDNLDDATESFKRVNSSGTKMSHFNMVSALAYSNDFDLHKIVDENISDILDPVGWGSFENTNVLRVIAGILRVEGDKSQHPLSFHIEKLANTLQEKGEDFIVETINNMAKVAELLKEVGVYGPDILPRSYQMIIPTVFISTHKNKTKLSVNVFKKWFWITTYGGVFKNLNSTVYNNALQGLEEMVFDGHSKSMDNYINTKIPPLKKFDYRTARSKACALVIVQLQANSEKQRKLLYKALAEQGSKALHVVIKKGKKSKIQNLAIIKNGDDLKKLKNLFGKLEPKYNCTDEEIKLLKEYGFKKESNWTTADVLNQRKQDIEKGEQKIIKEIQLEWKPNPNKQ